MELCSAKQLLGLLNADPCEKLKRSQLVFFLYAARDVCRMERKLP